MLNQPETHMPELQAPQNPLVLSAHSTSTAPLPDSTLTHLNVPIRPEQLIRHVGTPPPRKPLARLNYFWHQDPAYKVLMIAIAFVLLAGIVGIALASNMLLHNPNTLTLNSISTQTTPIGATPTGTVVLRPTFAPPGGGLGSGTSSQPPPQSTPILSSTPVVTPTDQPGPPSGGTLTVQITAIPTRVTNNSLVNVGVNTSEPNVTVTLIVLYNAVPFRSVAGPAIADGNGNANIAWMVSVYKAGGARAIVFAIAKDQNGQRAQSQPVSVQITGFGG